MNCRKFLAQALKSVVLVAARKRTIKDVSDRPRRGRTWLTPRGNVGHKWIYRFALFEDAFTRWDTVTPCLRFAPAWG